MMQWLQHFFLSLSLIQDWQVLSVIILSKTEYTSEPGHEKMCLVSYASNKGAD